MNEIFPDLIQDMDGHYTLTQLSNARNFNAWIYNTIKPWIHGRVFESGSGIGNITSFIVHDGFQLIITDSNVAYLNILMQKFKTVSSNDQIVQLDLVDPDFDLKFNYLFQSFDTVIAINVIEHIQDDLVAFKNIEKLLKLEGRAIILVPNGPYLYNRLDRNLLHFRRYSKQKISSILKQTGLHQEEFFYFNAIGIAGWFLSGTLLRNKTIPNYLIGIFEAMIPFTSWLDKLFKRLLGLSIVVICRKRLQESIPDSKK